MNGYACILYWGEAPIIGEFYNTQELNFLPFSTLNFKEAEITVRLNFRKVKLSYKDILKVRELKKPFRRIQIIGNLNGKGYRLHYFPFSIRNLKRELLKREITIQETIDWYTKEKDNEDRENYNIPDYPTG